SGPSFPPHIVTHRYLSVFPYPTLFRSLPYKFEAGTPHIAGAVGLGAAFEWLMAQDRDAIWEQEKALLAYATEKANAFPGLRIIRSEEHTSELQSRFDLVCRLLLEKNKALMTNSVVIIRSKEKPTNLLVCRSMTEAR